MKCIREYEKRTSKIDGSEATFSRFRPIAPDDPAPPLGTLELTGTTELPYGGNWHPLNKELRVEDYS